MRRTVRFASSESDRQSSCNSVRSGQRDWGTPNRVTCTLLLMSGTILATEDVEMEDADLRMRTFFNTAEMALMRPEHPIRLVIGTKIFDKTAANLELKFFALEEVRDMIRDHDAVKIRVVRVHPGVIPARRYRSLPA